MRRISHDLPGVTQRISKLTDEFLVITDETAAVWKDQTGTAFLRKHTSEIRPTVAQLVSAMTKTIEMFEDISKKLSDPDRH